MTSTANKTPISLSDTKFLLSEVMSTSWEPKIDTFVKGKWSRVSDFGTIFIGCEPDSEIPLLVLGEGDSAPLFTAPDGWRMSHILKALGAFQSASEASKNGWNKEIPFGLSEHHFRLAKCFGSIHIFRALPTINEE